MAGSFNFLFLDIIKTGGADHYGQMRACAVSSAKLNRRTRAGEIKNAIYFAYKL